MKFSFSGTKHLYGVLCLNKFEFLDQKYLFLQKVFTTAVTETTDLNHFFEILKGRTRLDNPHFENHI